MSDKNVVDVLKERGFVEQVTDLEGLRTTLSQPTTCYVGFDPTADSFHIGNLVPIFAMIHMQNHGHRPIALLGGATAMVGDPSGKTEMRRLLSVEQIKENTVALKEQLGRFIDFTNDKALILNNADWLLELRYIDFLREIGRHFSVNRMLAAESYRLRLESGLSFIEFNYMPLQAYDFYYLATHYNCLLQMGGNDQWGNILAGIDLIRRKTGRTAYGLTFPLITTASGSKMGKTATGAVWLSAKLTSPFDFYQYWINVDDRDVERFLKLYTFLPINEIGVVASLEGQELNACKTILAFEVTALVHGVKTALEVYEASSQVFGRRNLPRDLLPTSKVPRDGKGTDATMPTTYMDKNRLRGGIPAFELFAEVGLCSSKSEARRLIQQGGGYVNNERLTHFDTKINTNHLTKDGIILLRAGKKRIHRICPIE